MYIDAKKMWLCQEESCDWMVGILIDKICGLGKHDISGWDIYHALDEDYALTRVFARDWIHKYLQSKGYWDDVVHRLVK